MAEKTITRRSPPSDEVRGKWRIRSTAILVVFLVACFLAVYGFFLPWSYAYDGWGWKHEISGQEMADGFSLGDVIIPGLGFKFPYLYRLPIMLFASAVLEIAVAFSWLKRFRIFVDSMCLVLLTVGATAPAYLYWDWSDPWEKPFKIGWYVSVLSTLVAIACVAMFSVRDRTGPRESLPRLSSMEGRSRLVRFIGGWSSGRDVSAWPRFLVPLSLAACVVALAGFFLPWTTIHVATPNPPSSAEVDLTGFELARGFVVRAGFEGTHLHVVSSPFLYFVLVLPIFAGVFIFLCSLSSSSRFRVLAQSFAMIALAVALTAPIHLSEMEAPSFRYGWYLSVSGVAVGLGSIFILSVVNRQELPKQS